MTEHAPRRSVLILAFLAVYFIWGSTYLAIRIAIETLPPLLMAGIRFLIAGSILFAIGYWRDRERPTRVQWRNAAVIGAFLLLGGNGCVVWAEQRVPSGLTALVIATVPLWMALLEWWRGESARPSGRVAIGLCLGLAGVAWLMHARNATGGRAVDPVGAIVLVLGSASWAWGSLVARRADLPRSRFLSTAMEMLAGGALLVLAGALRGEVAAFDPGAVSARSLVATGYLVVFGAIVAFSAYVFLLSATTPTRATTYAFVNPLVAVVLGWLVAGERIPPSGVLAAALIVTGVVLLVTASRRPAAAAEALPQAAPDGPEGLRAPHAAPSGFAVRLAPALPPSSVDPAASPEIY